MIILNKNNYFSLENRAITNSRLGDWLRGKQYFKKKHIDGTLDFKKTNAMVVGSVVDDLLTQDDIKANYVVGDKRLKEFKNREDVTVISQIMYDEMMGLAIAVEETSAFKDLKDYRKQIIFQFARDLGPHFDSIAGIPDFFKIEYDNLPEGKKARVIIVDLKTSTTIDPWMYTKHADGLGYYRQQAFYQILIGMQLIEDGKLEFMDEIEFISRHLVVEKTRDIYDVGTFNIDQDHIDFEKENIFALLEEVGKETEFKKKDTTWAEAVTI